MASSLKRTLIKNTFYVTLSQVLTVPLSMLSNAIMARTLAAEAFGQIYLASTLTSLAFLFVNFGLEGALPAAVARDKTRAASYLGSSLVSRVWFVPVAYVVVLGACHVLHYGVEVQRAVGIMFLGSIFVSVLTAGKETIRGFERIEIPAAAHLIQQLLVAVGTIVALLSGQGMLGTLLVQALVTALVIPFVWWGLRVVGVQRMSFDWATSKQLMQAGVPFVTMSLVGTLQPSVDAAYLGSLSNAGVVGSYSVARRLLGVLMLPASSLIGALYPTLCRLWVEDRPSFERAGSAAIRGVNLFAVPLALGCGLYPEVGVAIFGRGEFAGAEQDLRILSVFVLLVYVSMPLGTCILAAGKQRAWSIVQSLCVVVSLVADPFLVSWFQKRNGNGGMGVCVATVLSEVLVVALGVYLVPRGVIERKFLRSLVTSALAGAAMGVISYFLKPLVPVLVAAGVASVAYFAVLWAVGGIEPELMEPLREKVGKKLAKLRAH